MPAFLRIGVIKADLYTLGNVPVESDRHYNSARKGGTSAATRFTIGTDRTSAADVLSGRRLMTAMTSATEIVPKTEKTASCGSSDSECCSRCTVSKTTNSSNIAREKVHELADSYYRIRRRAPAAEYTINRPPQFPRRCSIGLNHTSPKLTALPV
jgi:hypothetical protein